MRVEPMREADIGRVAAAWQQVMRHDPLTEARFREVYVEDPNSEPEGTIVAWDQGGSVLGFAATVVRRTAEGKDGGGRAEAFHRAFLKGFFVAPGAEGHAAAGPLLAEAEAYARSAGKTEMRVTTYTGPYVFPGIDLRYARTCALLARHGYRDVYTIESVGVDLADPVVDAHHARLRGKVGEGVTVVTWEPSLLPAMRRFVEEGQTPEWFPVGWESGYAEPQARTLILRMGEEVLGWARFSARAPRAGFGPILVLPRARGKDYGATLLLECMVRAREAGAQQMTAGWANTGFYVRHGWHITRRYAVFTKEIV